MRIVYLDKLNSFAQTHANARKNISTWKVITDKAIWRNKQGVLADFPNTKMIKNNRARFEIAHNTYRLIVHIDYADQLVEIRFIGTHAAYDKIDPETI
jgi:mRNA interferase HigB